MNKKIMTLWVALCCAPAFAQDAPPDFPPLPSGPAFNPTNPFMSDGPLTPIAPAAAPIDAPPALPALDNPDDFDFFQPGAQLGDLGDDDNTDTSEVVVETAPAPRKVRRKPKARFSKRFNYKIQTLPPPIYKKHYRPENRHLPIAQYQHDYDHATFVAAANNDLNGLRAMIDHGGRSIAMRNARGQTLADVAIHHQAHDTLRYLLAKSAPVGTVASRADTLSQYALQAGR